MSRGHLVDHPDNDGSDHDRVDDDRSFLDQVETWSFYVSTLMPPGYRVDHPGDDHDCSFLEIGPLYLQMAIFRDVQCPGDDFPSEPALVSYFSISTSTSISSDSDGAPPSCYTSRYPSPYWYIHRLSALSSVLDLLSDRNVSQETRISPSDLLSFLGSNSDPRTCIA